MGPLGCKEDWGHECGNHIMGLVLLEEEEDQLSLSLPSHPLPMSTHPEKIMLAPSEKAGCLQTRNWAVSWHQICWSLVSDFSTSRTIRNKCRLFSHSLCGISLKQLAHTKTGAFSTHGFSDFWCALSSHLDYKLLRGLNFQISTYPCLLALDLKHSRCNFVVSQCIQKLCLHYTIVY